jgi:hypothetical protein
MKLLSITAVTCLALGLAAPASAQSSNSAQSIINLIGSAVANARVHKSVAELSAPLQYEDASGPLDPANRADPRNADVAGVRLGMTPAQAERALRALGYADSGIHGEQLSYDSLVRSDWATRFGKPSGEPARVPDNIIWRKAGQQVTVTFIAMPDGPRANEITYEAGESGISDETFLAQVQSKYGSPINDDPKNLMWCTIKAPDCEDPRSATYPVLAAWTSNRSIILVGNDPGRDHALQSRRAADVASKQPAAPAPAF